MKPPALRAGDTVGVVAPAAAIERDYLERGVNALIGLGYRVKVSERALARSGILAGEDRERASELQSYFADPEVRAIFAARGGYGSGRLLPLLDFAAIAGAPKIFLGFSDETFILNALVERASIIAFHGPMVAMDFARGLSRRSLEHLRTLLAGQLSPLELGAREALRPGTAEGELIGGCLSVVVAMLATPYAPDFRGRILFLEDTGEKPYRVDRMLVQLKQAGAFDELAGIVFGGMRGADGSEQEARLVRDFILDQVADFHGPVLSGIEAGHATDNLALPLGVRMRIDSERRHLLSVEPAVS